MIMIHHPGTGTVIDLSECIVADVEELPPMAVDVATTPNDLARHSSATRPVRRIYLLAVVGRGPIPDGGTEREALVLNTVLHEEGGAAQTMAVDWEDIQHFDDVHDLFVGIF